MSSNESVTTRRRNTNVIITIFVIIVAVLLIFSIYESFEIASLASGISSLQDQNANLQQDVGNLQAQIGDLESQVQSLTSTSSTLSSTTLSVELYNVCLSATADCNGTYVYLMGVSNTGGITIPANYSVFLSFKDGTAGSFFSFNTTIGTSSLLPGQSTLLLATSWPKYPNGTSIARINSGDSVGVSIGVGSYSTATPVQVQP